MHILLACVLGLKWFSTAGYAAMPETYRDAVTGSKVTVLTPDLIRAEVTYQTHPMWVNGTHYLVFFGEKDGKTGPWMREMSSGVMQPLLRDSCGGWVLLPRKSLLYYFAGNTIRETAIFPAFRGEYKSTEIAGLPPEADSFAGGLGIDSTDKVLYTGIQLKRTNLWGVCGLDLNKKTWRMSTIVDFKVGHIQPNPFKTGVVSFCWETGGDAPQRTWLIEPGTSQARPFYKETFNEWVTHEVWWGPDRMAFTIWPYDEEHAKLPHGVASATLPDAKLKVHAPYRAWHTHGSPDGHWLVCDDFEGNLWLIQVDTNERRLLTQGHRKHEIKNHPHPSFTPDNKGVVFTSSRNGKMEIFLVEIPSFDALPK